MQDKVLKLKTYDLSYFLGRTFFVDDGVFVFQPFYRCFKKIGNNNRVSAWKSKGLSDESIKPLAASNNNISPALNYNNAKIRVKFDECC